MIINFPFLCCLFCIVPRTVAVHDHVCQASYAVEQPWRWRQLHSEHSDIWPRLRWQMFHSAVQSTLVCVTDERSVNQDFIIDNRRKTWRQTDVSTDCHNEACILSFDDYVPFWDSEHTTGCLHIVAALCQVSTYSQPLGQHRAFLTVQWWYSLRRCTSMTSTTSSDSFLRSSRFTTSAATLCLPSVHV